MGIIKKKFDGGLKKRFANTYEFSSHDIKKFKLFIFMKLWMIGRKSVKHLIL